MWAFWDTPFLAGVIIGLSVCAGCGWIRRMKKTEVRVGLSALCVVVLAGCTTVPETGRKQFVVAQFCL